MRDRWRNRAEPAPGFGTIYWHVLMSRYEEALAAGNEAQDILSQFSGFHPTPPQWFHMTTLLVGPADNVTQAQLADAVAQATRQLEPIEPPAVVIGRVIYHPEAILLAIEPAESLQPIRNAVEDASAALTGTTRVPPARSWVPHMTVAYSVAEQPTAPISAALGHCVTTRRLTISAVTLVVQWGPERLWEWELVGEVELKKK